ncbi:MAG TPA: ABC transporter permease [Streptosporangiaceae bacterium]|jgi:putative ABC transport system permease protein|nr:ABC transporter permease [Streptosporangiaceae bacterium]
MSRLRLVGRLVARDLRRRPGQAVLMLLAITAATATLTLGLVLHGVTSQPYQQTRAATRGPDELAYLGSPLAAPGPRATGAALHKLVRAQAGELARAPGVTGSSGPYPLAGALVRANGLVAGAEAEGRDVAPASVDQPALTAGSWVRPGGVVLERTFAAGLGVGAGDRITLNGRPYTVAGIAVTAANSPYPNLCYYAGGGCFAGPPGNDSPRDIGLLWLTRPDALSLATPANPVTASVLNLRLANPATAQAFADRYAFGDAATRHPAALARALGATPRNVAAGLTAAQLLPAVPGTLFGIPLGIGLFAAADHGGLITLPAAWWLAAAVLATLAAVAGLAAGPARVGARRPTAEILQAETA